MHWQEEVVVEDNSLSDDQVQELKAMFNMYDKNRNGVLDKCVSASPPPPLALRIAAPMTSVPKSPF